MNENKWEIEIAMLKTSNGTLKVNTDRIGKLAKNEMYLWLSENITNNFVMPDIPDMPDNPDNSCMPDILDMLNVISKFIANIDVIHSNVISAVVNGYTKPEIRPDAPKSFINAIKLRHPIIEHINTTSKYVPNDIIIGDNNINGILLFGINAVGKSSLMKSVGINIIMAQAGMYVPASKFIYKPYKYLFTRIMNNDNLYAGLSSFEVEMKEFKVILKYANNNSIILGDELASGTNTEDATAIVASGIIELSKRNSNFLFATHLHFLAEMKCIKEISTIRLCHLLVERDPHNPTKLIYNRTLLSGNGPKSYGILVCEAMNMDRDFLIRAKMIRDGMRDFINPAIEYKTGGKDRNIYDGDNGGGNNGDGYNGNCNNGNCNNGGGDNGGGNTQYIGLETPESEILNTFNINLDTKYNSHKIVALCEICNNTKACDVHHISQQCDANSCGLIDNYEFGIFNKNKLWNLISLCKICHQSVHSTPSTLNINGYITTSKGIELKYKWVNKKQIMDSTISASSASSANNNIITDTIKTFIIEMKTNNQTPKKIQVELKRQHNITITQQIIRDIL